MIARLVGRLLALANAAPPFTARREFYALKDRLLARYGERDGEDLQHIVDPCWRCADYGRSPRCGRCLGSGVYRERWVRLARWTLGGRRFHSVIGPVFPTGPCTPTLEGRVSHLHPGRVATEAALWLALAFDRRLFLRLLVGSRACGWTWWPLVSVQKVACALRGLWLDLQPATCSSCGATFRRLWGRGQGLWLVCRDCRGRAADGEELPF